MALRAEIFFGRMKRNEHPAMPAIWIGDQQFNLFLRRKLSNFPGFTVLQGDGFWKGEKEPSSAIILYGPDNEAFKREVAGIAQAYAVEHNQEAVAFSFDAVPFYLASAETVTDAFPDYEHAQEEERKTAVV